MKTIKIISAFIIIGALTIGSLVHSAETLAIVLKVRGSVSVYKPNTNSPETVKRGYRLEEGYKLVTGDKSFVALRFIDDASLVRIGANSTCTIQGRKDNNQIFKNVMVEAGTIFTRITDQKGQFSVATPTSVASVKGTEFITDHHEPRGTHYFNEEGLLEISNDAGIAMLNAGETAYVASENTAPVVRKTIEGEKPTLEDIDEIEDEFEFEFENEDGQKKILKFKVIKK